MASEEAREVLCDEKKASGARYAVIIENALLHFRESHRTPIAHNNQTKPSKILIDENSIVAEDMEKKRPVQEISFEYSYILREGLLPRLLRESSGGFFKHKK